jgi:hypothetical protein
MRKRAVLLLAILAAFSCVPALAQQPVTSTKVVTVAAFKNGLGFFVRQGPAKLTNGWGVMHEVPSPSFGSLWLGVSEQGASVDELVAMHRDVAGKRNASDVRELLTANTGKVATVEVGGKLYTGTILSTSTQPAALVLAGDPALPVPEEKLLLMKFVDGNVAAFDRGDVRWASFGEPPATTIPTVARARALKFKVKNGGESVNMTMSYLQRGIGWSPSYLITLEDDKTARITMQAILVDDVEDLVDVDVFFVVGVPNFAFSEIISPMALQQTLADFISNLQGGGRRDFGAGPLANVMSQSVAVYDDATAGAGGLTVAELAGAPEEDLFLYARPRVTLARGERGTYSVFATEVGYEHVYEWTIPDTARINSYGQVDSQTVKEADRVWHSLRLANSSTFPWTTAPAMVVSGQKPIAQDTLGYTPKGATNTLKLTVATDVQTDKQEIEASRRENARQIYGSTYDEVTVQGTLKIRNFKTRDVKLTIRKTVTGEVDVASDGGATTKLAEAFNSVNPTSRIAWEVPLGPGAEKVITYRYRVYVRS